MTSEATAGGGGDGGGVRLASVRLHSRLTTVLGSDHYCYTHVSMHKYGATFIAIFREVQDIAMIEK